MVCETLLPSDTVPQFVSQFGYSGYAFKKTLKRNETATQCFHIFIVVRLAYIMLGE